MDRIIINQLKASAIIGITKKERTYHQDILITATIKLCTTKAQASDKIIDTLDYWRLSQKLVAASEKSRFQLLEKLIAHLLDIIFQDIRVQEATIRIDKPQALKKATSAAVEISRTRDFYSAQLDSNRVSNAHSRKKARFKLTADNFTNTKA